MLLAAMTLRFNYLTTVLVRYFPMYLANIDPVVLFEHRSTETVLSLSVFLLLFIFYTLHTFKKYTQKTNDTVCEIIILMFKQHFSYWLWCETTAKKLMNEPIIHKSQKPKKWNIIKQMQNSCCKLMKLTTLFISISIWKENCL
jgi:hypothetical protein